MGQVVFEYGLLTKNRYNTACIFDFYHTHRSFNIASYVISSFYSYQFEQFRSIFISGYVIQCILLFLTDAWIIILPEESANRATCEVLISDMWFMLS